MCIFPLQNVYVPQETKGSRNGTKAMYVSYAKDIFIKLIDNAKAKENMDTMRFMELSIALVKQAETEFS